VAQQQIARDRVDRAAAKPEEVEARLQELEGRLAADTRTDAEKWLGDPPPDRSALSTAKRRLDT
jgi:hypothetical protein